MVTIVVDISCCRRATCISFSARSSRGCLIDSGIRFQPSGRFTSHLRVQITRGTFSPVSRPAGRLMSEEFSWRRLQAIYTTIACVISRYTPRYNNIQLTRGRAACARALFAQGLCIAKELRKPTPAGASYRCFHAKCRVILRRGAESVINLKNERRS